MIYIKTPTFYVPNCDPVIIQKHTRVHHKRKNSKEKLKLQFTLANASETDMHCTILSNGAGATSK